MTIAVPAAIPASRSIGSSVVPGMAAGAGSDAGGGAGGVVACTYHLGFTKLLAQTQLRFSKQGFDRIFSIAPEIITIRLL